ncbi:MAG: endonuclease/exonuclease/phosphatase family protein [Anaerolineae bacterium]|nr:endonuclease/exonuclease/phosphatase family protein [Anaerolineae bacterium]
MSFILRVAVLNLRHNADRWPERLPVIVEELARERPHLVGLQEVHIPIDQAALLTARLNEACAGATLPASPPGEPRHGPYEYRQQPKVGAEGLREGIAVLSSLPVEEHGWLDLGGGSRVAQRLRVRLPGGQAVDLYNTHLHHEWLAHDLRRDQAARLLEWMKQCSTEALPILVGDLNAQPDSPAVRVLKRWLVSAYETVNGREPEYTFPTPLVGRDIPWHGTLDYIMLPPPAGQVSLLRAWRAFERPAAGDPTLYASDHYGLMADVAFGGSAQ